MAADALKHLYPTLEILAEALRREGLPCQMLGGPDARRCREARPFRRGAAMDRETVYVLDPEDAEAFPPGYASACVEPGAAGARLLCPGQKPGALLDALLTVFARYRAMEAEVDALVYRNAGLQALCELGAAMMGNPVCVHDDWFVMAARSAELTEVMPPDYIMSSSREFMPRIIVEDFKNDAGYLETYESREARFLELQPRCLYVNLWDGSVYRGRLLAAEYHRPFTAEDAMVAELLAQRALLLLGRGGLGEGRGYRSMDDILCDLLCQRQTEAQEEARFFSMLNWGRGDRLLCVRLASQQGDMGVMLEHVLHSDLFLAFPDSYVMFAGQQQCVVMDLSRADLSLAMLRHRIAPLCRDYALYAGISSPVNGAGELYIAYRQAGAALDRAFQLRSDRWILNFSECALEYMLSRAQGEMPLTGLVAPELQRLIEYDRDNGTQYFETLRTYLLQERDVPRTAEALIIHRTTLLYRLKKLKTVVSIDMDDPWRRLYLILSLWILASEGKDGR